VEKFLVLSLMVVGLALCATARVAPRPGSTGWNISVSHATTKPLLRLTIHIVGILIFGLMLYALRVRTHFLGDGMVWLTILETGQHQAYSEPLAAALWTGVGILIRWMDVTPEAKTFGLLSVLCGLLVYGIMGGIARQLLPEGRARLLAFTLLLSLGTTQLYCGYLESYPPATVFILAFLWLGLRHVQGRGGILPASLALSLATSANFLSLSLWPSYFVLALGRQRGVGRRIASCLLPGLMTGAILAMLGSRPGHWWESLRIASGAVWDVGAAPHLVKPYSALSTGHALDLGNEVLLVLPIPLLLAIAVFASGTYRPAIGSPRFHFLAAASFCGMAAASLIVLPAPAAQDWDLISMLLLPAAVGCAVLGGRLVDDVGSVTLPIGIGSLALGTLLSFLLVNASERAGIERFKTLLAPTGRTTAFGRAYPNSLLAEFYEDRRHYAAALAYARRALEGEPTNPRYWIKAGTDHFRLGRFAEAAGNYEEAIRRGADNAGTRHDLGLTYAMMGRSLDAIRELRLAVGMPKGDHPDYVHDLGVAYAKAGFPDSARAVWTGLLKRWPAYAPARRALERHFGAGP
jgi:hypothetical protein